MFNQLLEQIAKCLESSGISYMVIGGQALLRYGEPRLTKDIDVTLGIGPENATEILRLVSAQSWRPLVEKPAEFVSRTLVLPCIEPASGIRIDFIFSVSIYEKEALQRARALKVENAMVRFASAEDVIIHKMVAGRPRDLEDVRVLLSKDQPVDFDYIRSWLAEFDHSLNRQFLEELETIWIAARGSLPASEG